MVGIQGVRRHGRSALLGTVAALGAFGIAGAAFAADEPVELDTVLVTAQKRVEKLEDIPASITAVTSEQLAARGVTDTLAIQHATPGVVFGTAATWTNFYMRGLGNANNSPGAQSPVALYVDGVYLADVASTVFGLDDVNHIEILKGPQGSLYGRNAVGGAINIITEAPASGFRLKLKASLGNYNEQNYGGYLNVGSDTVQANLAINRHTQDGWYRNVTPGAHDLNETDDFSIRGKLRVKPAENVDLTLSADYLTQKGWAPGANSLPIDPAHGIIPTANAFGAVSHVPVLNPLQPWRTSQADDLSNDTVNKGASLTGRVNLPGVDLVSITAYRDYRSRHGVDFDGSNIPLINWRSHDIHTQFSQELQLISRDTERFSWIVGLYYLHDNAGIVPIHFDQFASFGGVFIDINSRVKSDSYAVYGEGTYKLTDELSVVLGGRYSKDKLNHYVASQTVTLGAAPVVLAQLDSPGSKEDFSAFTPRLTLKYERPEGIYYATASKGYSAGLYNVTVVAPTAALDSPIAPQKVDAFEVGAKWVLLDRRLFVNAAAFHYNAKNLQLQGLAGAGLTSFENANGKIDGLDFDAEWRATSTFTVRAAFETLDARYSSYPNATAWTPNPNQLNFAAPPCGGQPNATPFDASCKALFNLTGEPLMRSPKFTSTVGFDWDLPIPDQFGGLTLTSDWYHSSSYRTTVNGTIVSPAYDMINASLNYTAPNREWSASLWGKNLNNAKYLVTGGEANYNQLVMYGAPRMYGVTISYNFDR